MLSTGGGGRGERSEVEGVVIKKVLYGGGGTVPRFKTLTLLYSIFDKKGTPFVYFLLVMSFKNLI